MSTILKDLYPGKVDETDPAFPNGKFKNETTPGALDGTPLEQVWQSDWIGFLGAIHKAANTTANGTPDTPDLSQLLTSLINVTYQNFIDYNVGVEALDGGARFECVQENGPGKPAGVKPTTDVLYWLPVARAQFDRQWPVGSIYHNASDDRNPSLIFAGGSASGWTAVEGRVLIGAGETTDSRGDARTFNNGQQGGEFAHPLTAAEGAEHRHALFSPNGSGGTPGDISANQTAFKSVSQGGITNSYTITRDPANPEPSVARSSEEGNGAAHNNIQPYRVVYTWQRTS